MPGSEIIICGKPVDVGHRVVTFDDEDGYNAYVPHRTDNIGEIYASKPAPGLADRKTRYRQRRLMGSSGRLSRLKHVVRQLVVHLDGCRDAKMCFDVLHNQRGLSVHFMIDNDGTIYQTLDLLHCAFHAGGVNEVSIGIEMQNRGDAHRYPNFYSGKRDTVTCRVHGHQFLAYDFTAPQYQAAAKLSQALARVFDLPLVAPMQNQEHYWSKLDRPRGFRGFLGHYHISRNKWDPGPWDFSRMFRMIGSRTTFPLSALPKRFDDEAESAFQRKAARYYEISELDTRAHFPLGPLGKSRLWHGGVHLVGSRGTPVYAAFRGRVVAAKHTAEEAIGSVNFVLLKHQVALGQHVGGTAGGTGSTRGAGGWTFYSLYYHLQSVFGDGGTASFNWLKRAGKSGSDAWLAELERGETVLIDVPVEAGEPIGAVGEAGPSGNREPQIHFAVFSPTETASRLDPGSWRVIEGGSSRLCDDAELLRLIDRPRGGRPRDGMLSRRELRRFFRGSDRRENLRQTVIHYRSEWTPGSWRRELEQAPDFKALSPLLRRRMIARQIRPTLWWTEPVARHAGLPGDGRVYAYHPIGFVEWFNRIRSKLASLRGSGIGDAAAFSGQAAPSHLTVDAESGDEMTDSEDFFSGEHGKALTLDDLVKGYPETDSNSLE